MKKLLIFALFLTAQLSFASFSRYEQCRVKLWQTDLQGAVEEYEKQGLLLGTDGTCDGTFIVQPNVAGTLEVIEISVKGIPGERFVATRIPSLRNWIAAFKLLEEDVSSIKERLGGEIPHVDLQEFMRCAGGPRFAPRWLRG